MNINIQKQFRDEKIVKIKIEIINSEYVRDVKEGISEYKKNCIQIEEVKENCGYYNKLFNISIDLYKIVMKKDSKTKKKFKKIDRKKEKYRRAVNFYEFVDIMGGKISNKTLVYYKEDKKVQILLIHFSKEKNAIRFKEIFFALYPECEYHEEFSEVI